MRKARTAEVIDEKQSFDMTQAGALTWSLSIPAMGVAFVLYEKGLFDPALWFPYYLLLTLLLYCLGTLYLFKRR